MPPPAAAGHEWQWDPVMAIDVKENSWIHQRYLGKRLLLCRRQMELWGEPGSQKWTARCFEVWPIAVQVQARVGFLKGEASDLVGAHKEAGKKAEEQSKAVDNWDPNDSV